MTQPDQPPLGWRQLFSSKYGPPPTRDGARQTNVLHWQQMLRYKRVRFAIAASAIAGSIIILLSQTSLPTWTPLPDDVPLSFAPTPKDLPLPGDVDWSRFAYSQYATNSAYLCNSLMLFESLHRLGSKADRLLMHPSSMKPNPDGDSNSRLLAKARDEYGVSLVPIEVQHRGGGDRESIHPPRLRPPIEITSLTDVAWRGGPAVATWADSYTKLLAFNQTQYARVLALDSDAALLQPMDELFLLPPAAAALPRAYWLPDASPKLTTALLLAQPSAAEFARVADGIAAARSGEFDMEIVNRLYGRDAMVLPHRRYTLLTGEFRNLDPRGHVEYLGNEYEVWDPNAALREAKYLHFSDWPMPKPWVNAAATTVSDVQPKCTEGDGKGEEEDCLSRELWLGFYADFKKRRMVRRYSPVVVTFLLTPSRTYAGACCDVCRKDVSTMVR